MYNHISDFNKLVAELINLKESFKDEDKAILLVSSLLIEYNHIVAALLHEKDKITFHKVCAASYNNEIQKSNKKEHESTLIGEAYTVIGCAQSRKPEKRCKPRLNVRTTKDKCAFCHEKEHLPTVEKE